MKTLPVKSVEYKTSDGFVLKPGDPAIAVTKSAGRANLVAGTYLGLRGGNCVMEVDRVAVRLVHKDTDVPYDWGLEAKECPWPRYDYYSRDPAVQKEYSKSVEAYNAEVKERRKDFVDKKFPYKSRTTLQLNKIFPGEIKAKDMSL